HPALLDRLDQPALDEEGHDAHADSENRALERDEHAPPTLAVARPLPFPSPSSSHFHDCSTPYVTSRRRKTAIAASTNTTLYMLTMSAAPPTDRPNVVKSRRRPEI